MQTKGKWVFKCRNKTMVKTKPKKIKIKFYTIQNTNFTEWEIQNFIQLTLCAKITG